MKLEWLSMDTVPIGERVFFLLRDGEKGCGELAVGMTFRGDDGSIDHWWTWGGPNSGFDSDEAPVAWAPLPEDWDAPLRELNQLTNTTA